MCEKTMGPEHTPTLETVSNIGALYVIQERFAEAKMF